MKRATPLFLSLGISLSMTSAGCETTWMDPMEAQKKYLPYTENEFFADGRAMRPLPEGTISREQVIGSGPFREGMIAGRPVDTIPIPVTPALLAEGRKRYNITCATCHGVLGNGDSVVARKMSLRPPPSLVSGPVAAYSPGRIFQVVSLGYGLMGSYSAEIPVKERWAVIAYMQALSLSQNAPLDSAPPEVKDKLMKETP